MKKITNLILLVAFTILAIAGCGGGGGGGGGVNLGSVNLFLSDSFDDDYSQVWLTIYKVELRDATTGAFSEAFESAEGRTLNVSELHDGTGARFAFLANGIPVTGTYNGVRVTFKDEAVLVPTGSTTGQTKVFDDSVPKDGIGRPMVTFNLLNPIGVGGSSVVIELDLLNFTLSGSGKLIPALKEGSQTGLDDSSKHEFEDYHGTVQGLGGTSFILSGSEAGPITIYYDGSTIIFRENTGVTATLANGQRVEVEGKWSPLGGIQASQIKIEDGTSDDSPEVLGTVTQLNLVADTMVLTNIGEVEGFVPQGSTVNVVWSGTTIFRRSGLIVDESYLALFPFAEVRGTYNSGSNTFTANRITIEDEGGAGEQEAECKGTAGSVNLPSDTMTLNGLFEIEGFTPGSQPVNITWTNETEFINGSGDPSTEAILFNGGLFEVKGVYNAGTNTLACERIKVED